MNNRLGLIVSSGIVSLVWSLFCIVIFVGMNGSLSWVSASLLILFFYADYMLWYTALNRRVAPLELSFWIFHANFLLLPALSQSLYHKFYWSGYDSYKSSDLLFACFLITIGLLAFKLGMKFNRLKRGSPRNSLAEKHFLSRPIENTWPSKFFLMALLVLLSIFILKLGINFFVSSRGSQMGKVGSLAELGVFLIFPRAVAFGVLLFSIALLKQCWRQRKKVQLFAAAIFIIALGLNAVVNFPLGLARFWIFGFLISLIWLVVPLRRAKWRSLFVVGMTLLQFTLFPWFSYITRGKGLLGFSLADIRMYLHHGDFDGFQTIVNSLLYIQHTGFEFGRNITSVVFFFVPRSFWINKAEPLGTAAAQYMGYAFTNLSAPIYAEFYADFGILSLIIGMGVLGFSIGMIDDYYDQLVSTKRSGIGVLFAAVMAGYGIILLRGPLLGVIPGIATLFGVILIASWLSSKRKPRIPINTHKGKQLQQF